MITQPEIRGASREADRVRLDLRIPPELVHFQGHFPEIALLPGVVQIDWAIRFAVEHFGFPPRIRRLVNVKMMHVIRPEDLVTLELTRGPEPDRLTFVYTRGEAVASSGRIEFALV